MGGPESNPRDAANRWRARPDLAVIVRVVAVAAPAGVALLFSFLAAHLVPPPHNVEPKLLWWLTISVLSVGVLVGAQRVARRLLPLAALLKLSLVFPNKAPGRYKLARKVGRPKDLEEQLRRAREAGHEGAETLGPQAVLELVAALSVHDRATRGHSERVRIFADLIAAELKLPEHDLDRLRWAALLHDVGKLTVSAAILRKAAKPTASEWAALKEHPHQGSLLIAPIAPWLGSWALAVDHHHERYDGAGYPTGLRAGQISLGGRIVAVADSYETMTAARPYKRPLSPTAARNELVACSGAQFDPVIVRAFLNISLGRLWRTIGLGAWLSQLPLLPQISSGLSVAGTQGVPLAARGAASLVLVAGASVAAPSLSAARGTAVAQVQAVQQPSGAPSSVAGAATKRPLPPDTGDQSTVPHSADGLTPPSAAQPPSPSPAGAATPAPAYTSAPAPKHTPGPKVKPAPKTKPGPKTEPGPKLKPAPAPKPKPAPKPTPAPKPKPPPRTKPDHKPAKK